MNSTQNESGMIDVVQMNSFQRVIGVFTEPTKTFEAINKKPDWLAPLIIVMIITMLFTYFTMPYIMDEKMAEQQEQLAKKGLTQEQIDRAQEIGKTIGPIIGIVGGAIGVVIVILVTVLILRFIGNVILSGKGAFENLFAVYTYTALVGTLGLLIKLPLVFSQETYDVHFSVASFLSTEQSKTFLYNFLKMFEFFSIWQYILVAIGFAVVYRFSLKKAGWAVAIVFLIYSIIAALLASSFA